MAWISEAPSRTAGQQLNLNAVLTVDLYVSKFALLIEFAPKTYYTSSINQTKRIAVMIEVGAFEAKTHLSALLEKVKNGEEVLITKRGKAIARLVPAEQAKQSEVTSVIDELCTLRKQVNLNGLDWKALRDDGRR